MSTLNETVIAIPWSSPATAVAAFPSPAGGLLLPTTGALLLALVAYLVIPRARGPKDVHALGGLSVLTAWPFFNRRYDFLKSNFAKTGEKLFSFKVLQHSVVAMKGEAARKMFFDNAQLDFQQGYRILMGAAPRLEDIDISTGHEDDTNWFKKQLLALLSKDRVNEVLPTLFDDIQMRMESWGKQGQMDPFKNIWDLVFQMTIRMASCRELATDMVAMKKLQADYWMLEKSATPVALLLPWLPSEGKKNQRIANQNLYDTLGSYVEKRKAATTPTSDAIDLLLARGLSKDEIIACVLGIIFAGVINTGISACWLLVHLAFKPEWKQKVTSEIHAIIDKHTNTTSSDPIHQRLAAVPVSVWEEEMPTFDLVLREMMRVTLNGTVLRRNVHEDLDVSGKLLTRGNFVAYNLSDVHLNPEIYTNPTSFDPMRFAPGREEDKNAAYSFLGWGAGRHPCAGMKIAKLEIKIIVALFLAAYEYEAVDEKGGVPECPPKPDYNDIHQVRPTGELCYFRYRRVVE